MGLEYEDRFIGILVRNIVECIWFCVRGWDCLSVCKICFLCEEELKDIDVLEGKRFIIWVCIYCRMYDRLCVYERLLGYENMCMFIYSVCLCSYM